MNKSFQKVMIRFTLTLLILNSMQAGSHAASGILTSQIGYDTGNLKLALVRSDDTNFLSALCTFQVTDSENTLMLRGLIKKWGKKWNSYWWLMDFSELDEEEFYIIQIINAEDKIILSSDSIILGRNILWEACFETIAFDFLEARSGNTRTGLGWRDSGSDLQEFSSHVVAVDGLCDLIELGPGVTTEREIHTFRNHLVTGCSLLVHLQDKAKELGLGDGAVLHEDRQDHVVTGNVAKAAMIFARTSRILLDSHPDLAQEYPHRAKKAFQWITGNGPILNEEEQIFYAPVHGAPDGTVPPEDQWMTRDLIMMMRAAIELYKCGMESYQNEVKRYAILIMNRQVRPSDAEGGLYGHFGSVASIELNP